MRAGLVIGQRAAPHHVARRGHDPVLPLRGATHRLAFPPRHPVLLRDDFVRDEDRQHEQAADRERAAELQPEAAVAALAGDREEDDRQHECQAAEEEVMDVREAIHHERDREEERVADRRLAPVDEECRQQQRQPAGPDDLQVREVIELVREERGEDAGQQRRDRRAGDDAREHVAAVAREGEAEEHADVVDGDRREAGQEERQREERLAEEVLAECEGHEGWRVHRRLEDLQRRVRQRPAVPVDEERDEQRVALIRHRGVEVRSLRPRERNGGREEEEDDQDLAEKCSAAHASELHTWSNGGL